jgi:CTP synthase
VGKYTGLLDAYKSLNEALAHGGIAHNSRVQLDWVDSEIFERGEEEVTAASRACTASWCPAASASAARPGKIEAVRFARERRVPFFGICFGMQMAVIEAARNLVGLRDASSTEFGPATKPWSAAAPSGCAATRWSGATRRRPRRHHAPRLLPARLGRGLAGARGVRRRGEITERHRHRYEVNVNYKDRLEEGGLRFSGMSPDGALPEIVEYPDHPWFIGVQFHPELKSKPFAPHPLFAGFVGAAVRQARLV